MLSSLFDRFIDASPTTVMARAVLERMLPAARLDAWFDQAAEEQYTRELLFSSVFGLMSEVVCGVRSSVSSAYQAAHPTLSVSIQSVYNKLNGLETPIAAGVVRFSGEEAAELIEEVGGARAPLLPGYVVKMLDGNCIEASEHRLKELRPLASGALPGKSLVVYDPRLDVAVEVFPCEDGHAQERALLSEVLPSIKAGEVWVADRNFCVRSFLLGIRQRDSFFVIREHQKLSWRALGPLQERGTSATGEVAEQRICIVDDNDQDVELRRIQVRLKTPTRDGDRVLYILTNLPVTVSARAIAELYRKRWTIETAFQALEKNFNSEINTLGYPRAALFGFCVALVAYNTLAVVQGALRAVHGTDTVDNEVSSYYLAEEMKAAYYGMMIAIPPSQWSVFSHCSSSQMGALLLEWAAHVRLAAFRKHRRGPKKLRVKPVYDAKRPHVSTAKLIAARCA